MLKDYSRLETADFMHIPLLSSVGAAHSFEEVRLDGWPDVPRPKNARASDEYCLARVEGDSMIDASIFDGDRVVI